VSGRAKALSEIELRLLTHRGVKIRNLTADELLVVQAVRPRWATAAAIVLAVPTLGLGLLLLTVRSKGTLRLRLIGTPDGLTLHLRGTLDQALLDDVRSLRAAPAASAPLLPEVAEPFFEEAEPLPEAAEPFFEEAEPLPEPAAPGLGPAEQGLEAELTVRRPVPSNGSGPVGTMGATADYVLEFDTGARVVVRHLVLVGRDPAAGPGDDGATLVPIDDPERSVSKTHLAISTAPDGVWVVDRHSTNGVDIVTDGAVRRIAPGARVLAPRGATLRFGERQLDVI
jgi:hypothetical protein